jgi:hypothetical protein
MNKSTAVDVNYISYACDQQGNCAWSYKAGSPDIEQIPAPELNNTSFLPDNPTQYASVLKIADKAIINFTNITVDQASENAVDINNNVSITIDGVFGNSRPGIGNQIFSVKGNSSASIRGTLKGAGNRLNADILVDNWSDQDYNPSIVDLTQAKHETGRKIKVVYRIGSSKIVGECNKLLIQSALLTVYFYIKLATRKLLRIKQGQKGPSFL